MAVHARSPTDQGATFYASGCTAAMTVGRLLCVRALSDARKTGEYRLVEEARTYLTCRAVGTCLVGGCQ